MSIPATLANMKQHYADGVFAYSPRTGERYSAAPGDYFLMQPGDVLPDSDGNPMVLACERVEIIELEPN